MSSTTTTRTSTTTRTAREYLRVSMDRSGRLVSPEEQHDDNALAALSHSLTLGSPYREAGAISASIYSRKSRPAWEALAADVQRGTFGADALVLWEVNRASRRVAAWAPFLEDCARQRISILVTSHEREYRPWIAADMKSLLSDGLEAQHASALTSQAVGRAMRKEASMGQHHGRPPFGYVLARRVDDGSPLAPHERPLRANPGVIVGWVPDPGTAPVVRLIFASIKAGESRRSIAAALTGAGPRPAMGDRLAEAATRYAGTGAPGAPFTPGRVGDIARNPTYAALRRHTPGYRGGHQPEVSPADVTAGAWAALVPVADYWEVAGKLHNPSRRTTTGPGRQPKHLLSMIATCGTCGGPVSVRQRHGSWRYTGRDCGHVTVSKDDADSYVSGVVLGMLAAPDAYAARTAGEAAAMGEALAGARDALATVKAEHDELTRMVGAGKLSAVLAAQAEPAILARLAEAERRVADLSAPADLDALGMRPGPDVARRWDAAPLSARRAVVRAMFAAVIVRPVGRAGASTPIDERVTLVR